MREAEEVASAAVVGVDVVDFLGLPDGVLEYGVALRRVLAAEIRRHRPDIVITGNFRDTFGGRNLNQADHIAVGRADARRRARRRATAGSSTSRSRTGSSRGAASGPCGPPGSPDATHGVDTTDTFDAGVESLEGPPGLHRRPRLGELGPRRVPRGHRPRRRPAAGRGLRRLVRGVPDGLGRLRSRDRGSRWSTQNSLPLVPCWTDVCSARPEREHPPHSRARLGRDPVLTCGSTGSVPACRRALTRRTCDVELSGSPGWTRTNNPPVNSRMLCQLSYRGSRRQTIARSASGWLNRFAHFAARPGAGPARPRRPPPGRRGRGPRRRRASSGSGRRPGCGGRSP